MVTPCISLLRHVALQVNTNFGARLGSKHHTPDITRDLTELQDSMRANSVFRQQPGRILRGIKSCEVPNAITTGLLNLHEPLADYNMAFAKLQRRRRQTTLGPLGTAVPDLGERPVAHPSSDARPLLSPFESTYTDISVLDLSSRTLRRHPATPPLPRMKTTTHNLSLPRFLRKRTSTGVWSTKNMTHEAYSGWRTIWRSTTQTTR